MRRASSRLDLSLSKGVIMTRTHKIILTATAIAVVAVPAYAQMRRNIRIVGSSTVYPFTKAVAERFARANPGIPSPIVESTGTGSGIKLFCNGVGAQHPDVVNASRRMKASEYKACAANGVSQITEIQVGLDGITLATSKATGMSGITTRDFYLAVAKAPFGRPNTAKTWKDVNSKLPAIPIRIIGPASTSGTRDTVYDLLMIPVCETSPAIVALKKSDEAKYNTICKSIRSDGAYIEAGENDNLIVQKLQANVNTMGIFGYSYLEENLDKVKGIAFNGVGPTYATISTFQYPGARPLFIYVKNAHAKAIPGIRQFAAEYVREASFGPSGYLKQLGLVASPDAARGRAAKIATTLTPLNPGALK
jgi:phosphate transport system substrate-binding protein